MLALANGRAMAFANWYSLRFSAIGDTGKLVDIANALKDWRPRISSVEAYPLAQDDTMPSAFRRAGWLVLSDPASIGWSIDTRGMDFDSYWAGRPSRLRNTAKRKAKAATLDIEVHTHFDPDAWADYEAVYAESWKGEEGSPSFLRALAEQEGAAGTLRLGIARHQGRPVAAQLWLVERGIATIHKLAYAESARDMSPGTLLSIAMFRHALDVDHVDMIDFGTGGDSYKAEWMERSEPLLRMRAYNPLTLSGLTSALRGQVSKLVHRVRSR
jgi:hypothetical protein